MHPSVPTAYLLDRSAPSRHVRAVTLKITVIHTSPQHEQIMIKLSELTGAVAALETKVDNIGTKLDAFLGTIGDPAVPAEAEAGLGRVGDKLAAIEAKIPS